MPATTTGYRDLLLVSMVLYPLMLLAPQAASAQELSANRKFEFLPILAYDADAGVGYGAKGFFLNFLGTGESFDCVLFNSSNGERWYKLVFSVPDFELRQGKTYPLAVDFTIDYDKWISRKFFGIGNQTLSGDEESYTREPLEISLMLGRGFTTHLIGQAGIRYRNVSNSNVGVGSMLLNLPPTENAGRISYISLQTSLRFDTRNSFINPSQGIVLQGDAEYSPRWDLNDVAFARYQLLSQAYFSVVDSSIVVAARGMVQSIRGDDLPVQVLLPIGGGSTVRGLPQDRYLDKVAGVFNLELRFPLMWRIGGIAGFDVGKVWDDPSQMDLVDWAFSPVAGLRLYMDTFVARLDVGFAKETTGVYMNFGQLF